MLVSSVIDNRSMKLHPYLLLANRLIKTQTQYGNILRLCFTCFYSVFDTD